MLETATLAGGCFWCTETVFNDVIGVGSVESGYIRTLLRSGDRAEAPQIPEELRGTSEALMRFRERPSFVTGVVISREVPDA